MALNSTSLIIESDMTLNKMLGEINTVEIPIIQRDYAQVRKNAKDFLRDIFVHLNNNQPMKLSFVYGTTSGGMYVPYDGQQRLTLVYLLTLFLASYCEDWDEVKRLSRFNYYTRDQATAFCKFLTGFDTEFEDDKKNVFQRIDIKDKSIQKGIENDSSFYGSWIYEPTVNSMIVVLQSIQDEFMIITDKLPADEKVEKAKEFLKQIINGDIFFDWCSIQASDNIYIKMNGRGKPLSAFDNFKNTLYAELDKLRKKALASGKTEKVEFLADFEVKMDGIWTDLFWKNRDAFAGTENYDIAPYMMNFLYYIFEFRHTVNCNSFFFGGKESFKWIDEKNVVTFLVKFKDLCDVNNAGKKGQITIDDYIWASKLLDIISDRVLKNQNISLSIDNYQDEVQLLKELSSHKGSIGSTKTVIVASLYYEYLVNASEFDVHGKLISTDCSCRSQWIELIKRLMKTASTFKARYDSLLRDKHILTGFVNVFVPVAFQNTSCGDFLISANNFDENKLKELKQYFDVSHVYSQLVEEIEKYKLKSNNPAEWMLAIEKAEKELPLFENMIYFLVKLSQDSNGDADVKQFIRYLNLMKQVVNEKGVVGQNYFSAIMLSFADYRKSSGEGYSNSWSLCSNTSTSEAFIWRYFFDVIEGEIAEKGKSKIDVLRSTLELIERTGNVNAAYASVTKNPSDTSWASVVIRYPEVLDMGSKHRIVYKDGSNWYLVKSDGVVKQVHSNSLVDSINIELFGLFKSSKNVGKLTFDAGKIVIDKDRFIKKDNKYVIHDSNGDSQVSYDEAMKYLDNI